MAGKLAVQTGSVQAEINLIPLIDVLLVLLVIFMLLQKVRYAIDAQVPPAEAQAAPRTIGHQLVLELTAGGGYELNRMPVTDADLDRVLCEVFQPRPTKLLFIKVSGERTYQEVVRTFDRARGAGVQVLALVPRQ